MLTIRPQCQEEKIVKFGKQWTREQEGDAEICAVMLCNYPC